MSNSLNITVLALLSLLFLVSTSLWHIQALPTTHTSLFLTSWDERISSGTNACFTFTANASANTSEINLHVNVNQIPAFSKIIPLAGSTQVTECIPANALITGTNSIELISDNASVQFQTIKTEDITRKQTYILPLISQSPLSSINWLWVIAFLAVFFYFAYQFTRYFSLPEAVLVELLIAYFISVIFVLVSESFSLQLNFILAWLSFLGLNAFAVYGFPKLGLANERNREDLWSVHNFVKLSVLVLVLIFLFHLFSISHNTAWNGFYERQTELLLSEKSIPSADPLSYLGRAFTFVPGYFFLEGFVSTVSQSPVDFSFYLMLLFSNLALLAACFVFSQSRKWNIYGTLLFTLILFSLMFIFNNSVASPRHALAFALLIYALTCLLEKRSILFTGFLIGLLAFLQIPALLWLGLAFIILYRGSVWHSFFNPHSTLSFALAGLLFLILYGPTLLAHGLPLEVVPDQWGYLLALPLSWFIADFNILPLLVLFLLSISSILFYRKLPSEVKKLFGAVLLLLALQFVWSFRWNLVFQLIFAVFLIEFVEQFLLVRFIPFFSHYVPIFFNRENLVRALLIFVFLTAMANNALRENELFLLKSEEISALQFVRDYTPENANVLSDPYYAHAVAYLGNRKVLSDLYVEYAVPEKLSDTYDFLVNGNSTVLSKYSIDYVFLNTDGTQTAAGQWVAINSAPLSTLNRIYSNGEMEVYSTR